MCYSHHAVNSKLYQTLQAHDAYADLLLQNLASAAHERWLLTKVAIAHRVGRVDVTGASVVICTSSPHRAAAMEACHWLIDELKATVPIWKREHFENGSVWKENAESSRACMHGQSSCVSGPIGKLA